MQTTTGSRGVIPEPVTVELEVVACRAWSGACALEDGWHWVALGAKTVV